MTQQSFFYPPSADALRFRCPGRQWRGMFNCTRCWAPLADYEPRGPKHRLLCDPCLEKDVAEDTKRKVKTEWIRPRRCDLCGYAFIPGRPWARLSAARVAG